MLSYHVNHRLEIILDQINGVNYFLENINVLADGLNDFDDIFKKMSENDVNSVYSFSKKLTNFKSKIKLIKPRKFFSELEQLELILDNISEEMFEEKDVLKLRSYLDDFSNKYENFLESHTTFDIFMLMQSAKAIQSQVDTLLYMFNFYLRISENQEIKQKDDYESLSIILSSSMTLSEFVKKLEAIEKIYDELIALFDISSTNNPLQIHKIESGSLFAKIAGNKKIIELMTHFIGSSVSFLYRNYTDEGKLDALPRKYDAIEKALEFSKQLNDAGLDTKSIDEEIQKSAVIIAKELTNLVANESEIIVNNEVYLGKNNNIKYLDNNKQKLLEEPKD